MAAAAGTIPFISLFSWNRTETAAGTSPYFSPSPMLRRSGNILAANHLVPFQLLFKYIRGGVQSAVLVLECTIARFCSDWYQRLPNTVVIRLLRRFWCWYWVFWCLR